MTRAEIVALSQRAMAWGFIDANPPRRSQPRSTRVLEHTLSPRDGMDQWAARKLRQIYGAAFELGKKMDR